MEQSEMSHVGSLFTEHGIDVWELESCFTSPSCTMRNLRTGEKLTFAYNGQTSRGFVKLTPIKPVIDAMSCLKKFEEVLAKGMAEFQLAKTEMMEELCKRQNSAESED